MNTFKLEPIDILVTVNEGKSPFDVIERWALNSPYSHVFMYLGQMGLLVGNVVLLHPFLFESNGRGVVIQSLSNRYGEKVVVMRLKSECDRRRIPFILEEAIKLASDEKSYYDYYAIVKFVLPMLICRKLGLPFPVAYHRDALQICSEACAEICWRAKVPVLPENVVPLPGDFVSSPLLDVVNWGILSADWV